MKEPLHSTDGRKQARVRDTLPPVALTRRHREVLAMVGTGMSTREIAAELHISPKTVENHRTELCNRLNLSGTLCLVRFSATMKAAILLSQPTPK